MATARMKNCTKRMISRVNKKNMATIPMMPRNNGPNRVCRYDTRPWLLMPEAVMLSKWLDIVTPVLLCTAFGRPVLQERVDAGDHGCPAAAPINLAYQGTGRPDL